MPSTEVFWQESSSPRTVSTMHAAAKVTRSCMLFISNLCFVHSVVPFRKARPEPARVEASASQTTVSPQCACAGSSFSISGWRKLVAGHLLSAIFTMQTMYGEDAEMVTCIPPLVEA